MCHRDYSNPFPFHDELLQVFIPRRYYNIIVLKVERARNQPPYCLLQLQEKMAFHLSRSGCLGTPAPSPRVCTDGRTNVDVKTKFFGSAGYQTLLPMVLHELRYKYIQHGKNIYLSFVFTSQKQKINMNNKHMNSKHILDNINKEVIKATKVNLWKSTPNVIEWFQAIPDKAQHAFVTFDVCDFYPSISDQLLKKALDYTSQFTCITPQDRHIIIHAKKPLLYHQNTPWATKNTNDMFDVTMGSYDGAETCELVGVYMLSLISAKFKDRVGLYCDDGLALCRATPKEIEKTKQEVSKIFKSNGLKITIEADKKTINFLDVTFDLTSNSYKPFMKPNNRLHYVNRQSNHPPALLKNIPENINKRLTSISSSKHVFDAAIPPYQKALDESGYSYKLTYKPQPAQKHNKSRQRRVIWYNPPWNSNVKANLGRRFLNIVDRCFPKNHPLHKIFNRHTPKLSYSCMANMKAIISSHNKRLLSDCNQSRNSTQTLRYYTGQNLVL